MNLKHAADFKIVGKVHETMIRGKFAKITTRSGIPVKDGGDWKYEPHWNQCTVFSEKLRGVAADLQKGDIVQIKGRMKQNSYTKNGKRVFTVDLIAYSVELVARAATAPREHEAA